MEEEKQDTEVDIEWVGKSGTEGLIPCHLCCNHEAVITGKLQFTAVFFYLRGVIGNLLENFLTSNLPVRCS